MSSKPIFVVVNAFSKQGISIINTLVEEGNYHIRATTTRPVDTPAALKLKERGVEVFQVDSTKKSDFNRVFKGAQSAFLMTPAISYTDPDYFKKEIEYVKYQADAALEEKLEHVIFSSVDSPVLTDAHRAEFKFDILTCRTIVQQYIESLPFKYVSTFNLAFFYSNQIEFIPLIRNEDGSAELALPLQPNDSLPYIDTYTATGPIVSEFLKHPYQYNRAVVPVVAEYLTGIQLAEIFQEVTGIKTTFRSLDRQAYIEAGGLNAAPELELLGNRLFEIWDSTAKYGYYYKHRNTNLSNEINPKQLNWRQFLETTKWTGESYQEFRDKNNY
ncbi:nucleoside-diphosphate-sugar epimerase [Heterostelium album PN500]|uniref:Nucleoside-diphosphate-sugar epimerase n=1 Tax=Heterostelium pallidum (strain ATCC 26659 / Pp 5 / PN500) TaxID=670386 RepID=D3AXH1_HETP5|nr:nucleoside-diphosphate-sugar epimerase [Heterostelium album PN500]EFA86240.1 nucleoside-diphosphate-sugar epimerase [Heterostelium album PN500]|eukprot:XP_020438345.1 nucleoside-diphosphate-sugar epimerase [Heterostelium album PN500]